MVAGLIYRYLLDAADFLYRISHVEELVPPRKMRERAGTAKVKEFKAVGNEFLKYFIDLCRLKPNERVLDCGCGCGRMAIPLTKYLSREGSYEGLDVDKASIDWCKRNITSKHPNFHFQFADVYNKTYNPNGKYKAVEYKFPYENESFDFVFLMSVFTHMLHQDMENYFSELSRVLRKDGRCLITFFILNEKSLNLIDEKKATLDFKCDFGEYRTINKDRPEVAVAYNERLVRALCKKHGLTIMEPIRFGSWCGRRTFLSYQDVVIGVTNPI